MQPTIAIFKAIMGRYFRDKTALFFTLLFPVMFLIVFGTIFGNNDGPSFGIYLENNADSPTATTFVEQLKELEIVTIEEEIGSREVAEEGLSDASLDAIVTITEGFGNTTAEDSTPGGVIDVAYSEGSSQTGEAFSGVVQSLLQGYNAEVAPYTPPYTISKTLLSVDEFSQFDFTFSGLLGFSVMSLGIFGMANGFASDKKTGAIARLHVAPIGAKNIIIAAAMNYILIGLLSVAVLFTVAVLLFDFNMQGHWPSFIGLTIMGTISMFGIGLAIAGWAKSENQAAPVANLIATPMMFLSGAFFPRFLMPEWLQTVTDYLPLTPITDGFRLILTEGKTLIDMPMQLGIIAIWTVAVYVLAIKIFRWE